MDSFKIINITSVKLSGFSDKNFERKAFLYVNMKKIMLIGCFAILLTACSNKTTSGARPLVQKVDLGKKGQEKDISDHPDYKKGFALFAQSDCFTCHKRTESFVGPPLSLVAAKYSSYPDSIVSHLAGRVISGGGGVWGSIPMVPHADLSKEDASAMIKYILLLKSR
jgi:cytochrome c